MNEKELRELDAFIAEHVFGWVVKSRQCPHSGSVTEHFWYEPGNDIEPKYRASTQIMSPSCRIAGSRIPEEMIHYTTDPAAAMQVLEKCLEKEAVHIVKYDGYFLNQSATASERGETLPLAICLFAKQLFSKC